jgi:hypothetical protein
MDQELEEAYQLGSKLKAAFTTEGKKKLTFIRMPAFLNPKPRSPYLFNLRFDYGVSGLTS